MPTVRLCELASCARRPQNAREMRSGPHSPTHPPLFSRRCVLRPSPWPLSSIDGIQGVLAMQRQRRRRKQPTAMRVRLATERLTGRLLDRLERGAWPVIPMLAQTQDPALF